MTNSSAYLERKPELFHGQLALKLCGQSMATKALGLMNPTVMKAAEPDSSTFRRRLSRGNGLKFICAVKAGAKNLRKVALLLLGRGVLVSGKTQSEGNG